MNALRKGIKMRNKFSLIELLVVVAIIGILVSILLPSLSTAREKTKRAVCLSQQKQLYLGAALYGDDNGDYLPRGQRYGGDERLDNQSLTYMAEEVYLDFRDNYLDGNDDIFQCINLNDQLIYKNDHKSYRIGYLYAGNKDLINSDYSYEFPNSLADSNKVVLWGDANIVSQWGRAAIPHKAGGGSEYTDFTGSLQAYGAEGGNHTLLDGSGKWYSWGALSEYEIFQGTPGAVKGWLPADMW